MAGNKQLSAGTDQEQVYLFTNALLTRKIHVDILNIGNNIKQTLEKMIAFEIEGKCIVEGFVKRDSTKIMTYSSGLIRGSIITFEVAYECSICSPVEGMILTCIAKNITKAGIRAEARESPSPVVIFVARDHHYSTAYFSEVSENDEIVVRVIGQRFELNDKYISIIAELLPPRHLASKAVLTKAVLTKSVLPKAALPKATVTKAKPLATSQVASSQVASSHVASSQVASSQVASSQVATPSVAAAPPAAARKHKLVLTNKL
jgi:hypothetical protein